MTFATITPLPTAPNRATQTGSVYSDAADAWAAALGVTTTDINTFIAAVNSGAWVFGTQTMVVLASSMAPNTTNGPASGTVETTTNKVMYRTLDYDQSTQESAQFIMPMPKSWNEGTVTVQFLWIDTASAIGSVVWGCSARAYSDLDVIDGAFGTAMTVIDTAQNVSLMQSAFTSALTIAGSPAAEDLVVFKFYRDAASGSDTYASDARLVAVRIKYTVDTGNDA
jgi:hypothetical protein